MTREDVLKLQTYKLFEHDKEVYVSRDDVLKALQTEPCEDAISRQAVRHILNHEVNMPIKVWKKLFELVDDLSPVQPQQKTGHWEYLQYDKPSIGNWHCSKCGRIVFLLKSQKSGENPLYDYCPWCGTKMEEGESNG